MMATPPWLGSPAIQELLHGLVDRLDGAEVRGSARAQSVALSKVTWPTLYSQTYESDREALWEQARELHRLGFIAITPEKAAKSASGYDTSPRIGVADATRVRAAVSRLQRSKSASELWREAVNAHLQAPDEAKKAVSGSFPVELEGHSPEAIVCRLNQLSDPANSGMLLREVSSRLFWGMSKVLDNRQTLVAAVLGVDECPFAESPIQLQVLLPAGDLGGVLFIENLMSFEKATRSKADVYRGLALVYASGFKASAKRLRSAEGVSLFYARRGTLAQAQTAAFENWLFQVGAELPVSFWGDLDWSGMRILSTLRDTFGSVAAWEPGYAPMRVHLLAGQGHQPEAAEKSGQRPLASTGCAYADTQLLPFLATHGFVDQELFNL
jgi:hypothetical protein